MCKQLVNMTHMFCVLCWFDGIEARNIKRNHANDLCVPFNYISVSMYLSKLSMLIFYMESKLSMKELYYNQQYDFYVTFVFWSISPNDLSIYLFIYIYSGQLVMTTRMVQIVAGVVDTAVTTRHVMVKRACAVMGVLLVGKDRCVMNVCTC